MGHPSSVAGIGCRSFDHPNSQPRVDGMTKERATVSWKVATWGKDRRHFHGDLHFHEPAEFQGELPAGTTLNGLVAKGGGRLFLNPNRNLRFKPCERTKG